MAQHSTSFDTGPDADVLHAGSGNMSITTIRTVADLEALRDDWEALQARAGMTPFTSFSWNFSWWQHLARRRLVIRDNLYVHALRDEDGELVAVAPLMLTDTPAGGPIRARCVQFFGADPNITELRGMLCQPGREAEAHRQLVEHLLANSEDWDWVQWGGLPTEPAVPSLIEQYAELDVSREVPVFLLDLPESWEAFKSSRSRNIKESLRKCVNSLKRDHMRATLRVIEDFSTARAALGDFLRLHSERAARTDTTAHPNVFRAPASRDFLFSVCKRYGEHGRLRIFLMEIGGQVVAVRIGFVIGSTLYLYYSGYDAAYGKYSVMTNVVAEAIKYAIDHGFRTVNLSTGRDVSKTRWSPAEIKFVQGAQVSPTARAPLVRAVYRGLRGSARAASRYAPRIGKLPGRPPGTPPG